MLIEFLPKITGHTTIKTDGLRYSSIKKGLATGFHCKWLYRINSTDVIKLY